MRRRAFLAASLGAATLPGAAWAQASQAPAPAGQTRPPTALRPIEPENDLERAFLAALEHEVRRPAFRRSLLSSQVALAMANGEADSEPRLLPLRGEARGAAIFTSASRLRSVLGPQAPYVMLTGREALERVRDQNVVINYRLLPMLTLEPADVASYLELRP